MVLSLSIRPVMPKGVIGTNPFENNFIPEEISNLVLHAIQYKI
jgi:hypothetical protein